MSNKAPLNKDWKNSRFCALCPKPLQAIFIHGAELHSRENPWRLRLDEPSFRGVTSAMMAQSLFKEQLLEFVEDRQDPFDIDLLKSSCNDKFIDDNWFWGALWELEEEGKIVRLNHHYLSTRVLMRRWIKAQTKPPSATEEYSNDLSLPQNLLHPIEELLNERPELGYLDVDEFIIDAIRRRIQQLKKSKGW